MPVAPAPSQPSTPPLFAGAALLDAEKLDAYRIALEFQTLSCQLPPKRGYAELRDQLDRASISIVLNIAEGCGRRSPADKARFYSMARGSATEGAAVLDLLAARGLVDARLPSRAPPACPNCANAQSPGCADGCSWRGAPMTGWRPLSRYADWQNRRPPTCAAAPTTQHPPTQCVTGSIAALIVISFQDTKVFCRPTSMTRL
jgi:four helix bundle protein